MQGCRNWGDQGVRPSPHFLPAVKASDGGERSEQQAGSWGEEGVMLGFGGRVGARSGAWGEEVV